MDRWECAGVGEPVAWIRSLTRRFWMGLAEAAAEEVTDCREE